MAKNEFIGVCQKKSDSETLSEKSLRGWMEESIEPFQMCYLARGTICFIVLRKIGIKDAI